MSLRLLPHIGSLRDTYEEQVSHVAFSLVFRAGSSPGACDAIGMWVEKRATDSVCFRHHYDYGRRGSLLVRAPDSSSKVSAGAAGEFSSPELTLCDDLFGGRSIPVLLQWHGKDHGHSAKSAGGRLHLNTHIPLT